MVQLIMGGVQMPETAPDKYSYDIELLGREVQAISGRYFYEERARIAVVRYSYDYLGPTIHAALMPLLRSRNPISVSYLDTDTGMMITEDMRVSELTTPTFAFAKSGAAYYHNYAFTLKGVNPLA
ncbi:MAG: hypothetical protein EOM54_05620 [Clostridia bacterium]|nr:hypothetical protein [Clostridia bacterium]